MNFSRINSSSTVLTTIISLFSTVPALLSVTSLAADLPGNEVSSIEISIEKPHKYADVFLNTDRFTGNITIEVEEADVGKEGEIYLVALYQNQNDELLFMKTPSGWRSWDGSIEGLEPFETKVLALTQSIKFLKGQKLPAGDYRIAGAYGVDDEFIYASSGQRFSVRDSQDEILESFLSEQAMSDYLKEGMTLSTGTNFVSRSTAISFAEDSAAASSSVRVSTTNLQETGVDEADTVKTDGNNLFALRNCEQQVCLDVYELDSGQAEASLLAEYPLENTVAPDGMYLVQSPPRADMLITIGGKNNFLLWLDVWGWSGNSTEIGFFNAGQPQNLVTLEKLTLDGALVSSRLVGNTLYVVSRYSPYIPEFTPLPLNSVQEQDNVDVLADVSLNDLVPQVTDSKDNSMNLVTPEDCYLPVNAVDRNNNPSIITITSIPIDNPTDFESACFIGGTESFYMSTKSIYLATTQWDYQFLSEDALVYSPNHSTTIHKFSLDEGDIVYRGSGKVSGHLGWSEDKKSFRMGENGEYLNIVTSLGDTWNESSSTQLTVLKESETSNTLKEVALIEGIGKPGEQLYAARFVGDRAYLVTFRLVDPLYVIDLADQENPLITGELEIDGYSDYLHPISENLLLGIGKDAIPDEGAFDFRGTRGAWYQGVKLSLFDVSDPATPSEIDALVLGKRGTESTVLWDHHALSFLPASGIEPARLAIPIQLHDTIPEWKGWDEDVPSAWYDFTHTGLYTFEISELGITRSGRIISETSEGDDFFIALEEDDVNEGTENADGNMDDDTVDFGTTRPVDITTSLFAPFYNFYSDRSVLLNDAVFYIHEGEIISSLWGEDIEVAD